VPIELKPPLSTYFEATNAHDAAAAAALFGENALVHDENEDHRGRPAIRNWAQGTYEKYDLRLMPHDAFAEDDAVVVKATVAGLFLGSPIELSFRFVVDGDRIEELRIG
jgi:SnoaL-like domain